VGFPFVYLNARNPPLATSGDAHTAIPGSRPKPAVIQHILRMGTDAQIAASIVSTVVVDVVNVHSDRSAGDKAVHLNAGVSSGCCLPVANHRAVVIKAPPAT
jgi:hypothetical protein